MIEKTAVCKGHLIDLVHAENLFGAAALSGASARTQLDRFQCHEMDIFALPRVEADSYTFCRLLFTLVSGHQGRLSKRRLHRSFQTSCFEFPDIRKPGSLVFYSILLFCHLLPQFLRGYVSTSSDESLQTWIDTGDRLGITLV